jgi:glycosyltransferase 2 family protein
MIVHTADKNPIKSGSNYKKPIIKFLFQYMIAATLLIYIFKKIPLSTVIEAIRHVNANLLYVGVLIAFFVHPVFADRLRRLGKTQEIIMTTLKIMEINFACLFYGLFLPGGNITVNAIRLYRLSGSEGHYIGAGVIILLDRVISAITLCITGIIFFLLDGTSESIWILKLMISVMVFLLFIIGLLYVGTHWLRLKIFNDMLNRIIFDKLIAVKIALKRIRNLSKGLVLIVCSLSFFSHLLGIIGYYFIILAMGIDIGFLTIGWIRSGIILATMIPVSISGLGLRESMVYVLMTSYGVLAKESIAFSLLIFFATILVPASLGGLWETSRLLKFKFAESK